MSSKTETSPVVEPVNGFFGAGKSRSASDVAKGIPAVRAPSRSTSQSRRDATRTKKTRAAPMAPTAERAAQGLIAAPKAGVAEAPHRVISQAEQLRDRKELCARPAKSRMTPDQLKQLHEKGKLDHDHRTSEGMYEAALRLRRHYEGSMIGTLKAQDLNRVIGLASSDDTVEESWVHHRQCFLTAVKLMGFSETCPHRGAGRIVVAVVCEDLTVFEAAKKHLAMKDTNALKATGMDRLREGLFALAALWRMI